MATGGFKPNAQTDFLEEWKAKREKMRAKMLGDIAAATGAGTGGIAPATASLGSHSNKSEMRNATSSTELNNNGNPDRGTSYPMARSSSSSALKRPDDDPHPTPAVRGADTPGSNLKKTPQLVPCTPQESSPTACNDHGSDKESPSPSKGKEKKNSGPSARKGKGQIEKRKLREKRRSTGVVSMPSTESLDELDDDGGEKETEEEQQLTQLNTEQNEAMTSDPGATTHLLQDTLRSGSGRQQSSGGPGSEEEAGAGGNSRHRRNRHGNATVPGGLERRVEELEKELARQRQENGQLLKAHQDKDDLIGKLKEEIDLLNRDLDDIEEENEQLKQENKTLLKVVGQLTR
ncbi:PRKC apoptosis WT1 regulator protein isoform X2 [Coregonus clupeaformis]|uniref:PRKC apoptosis WT1 regulator protein isoform X2 n=1 Tax=Coregonus clupeaformis TaxID=59861 RepID=UPI001E1C3059|nr:PRKC apoptosis WT1 regulator protein isoform X2 [Coregonus clupeaformis]